MSDLIERQAAIDLINDIDLINFTAKGIIRGRLRKLPSAQPERKRGKWIHKPNVYGVAYCSECDFELHINNTNFCPNCGAKMEVEHEA